MQTKYKRVLKLEKKPWIEEIRAYDQFHKFALAM
jgi:hypothetical protein